VRSIRRIGPWVAAVACFVAALTVVPTAWAPGFFVASALLASFGLLDGPRPAQVSSGDGFPSPAWRLRRDAGETVLEQVALAAFFERTLRRHRLLRLLAGALVYLPTVALAGVVVLALAMPGFSPSAGGLMAVVALAAGLLVPVVMFHRRGRNPVWFRLRLRDARLELDGAAAGWNRPVSARHLDASQLRRIGVVYAKVTSGPTLRLPCLVLHLDDGATLQLPPMPGRGPDLEPIAAAATLIGDHLRLPSDRIALPARDNLRLPADGKGA
jgi:hypothetical protein